jgi:ribosomal protein S18 acetylase RimI-like enzyme
VTALDRISMTVSLPVVLRLADGEDIPRLEWGGQYAHYRNLFRRAFREQLQGKRLILLADCNGYPIGQIFIQLRSRNGRIADGVRRAYFSSFRVLEMFQGCGIGTRLITEAEALVADRGFRQVTIAVAKDNRRALRLYERLGYHECGEDPGRWSYVDHRGIVRHVEEPCWVLKKVLRLH